MKNSRPARTFALQTLYAMELQQVGVQEVVEGVLNNYEVRPAHQKYGMDLVDLVQEHRKVLIEDLSKCLKNWTWERLALIDQLILQMALVEMRYKPEVPHMVVISEAVEIANKFSSEDSGPFVNGVLTTFLNSIPQ